MTEDVPSDSINLPTTRYSESRDDRAVSHLTRVIEAAAQRLVRAAEGERFCDDAEARALVAILKTAPKLLSQAPLHKSRKLVAHPFFERDIPEDEVPTLPPAPVPLIPPCPICKAGYGSHWPQQCPKNPNRKYKTPTPIDRQLVKKILRRYGKTDPTCETDEKKEADHD